MDSLSESLLPSRLYCLRTHGVANATIIDVIFIIFFLYLLSPEGFLFPFIYYHYFFLINGQTRQGSNVFMAHKITPANAAFAVPNTIIAHAPRTPTSAIGTFGVIVTSR